MLTAEEKLQHFSNMVFTQAHRQREEIVKQAEEESARKKEAFENECLEEAYADIQKQVAKIQRAAGEEISKIQLEARRALLLERGRILDEVFGEVGKRLSAFRATEEYRGFLKEQIRQALEELSGAKELTAFLDAGDAAYQEELAAEFTGVRFELADPEEEMGGGVRVYDRASSRLADHSMAARLRDARERFLGTSGLLL